MNSHKGLNISKGYRYSNAFKQEAINQVTVYGYAVVDVATRLGISDKTLYNRIKIFSKPVKKRLEDNDLQTEISRLKRELKRVEQERNILMEAPCSLPFTPRKASCP